MPLSQPNHLHQTLKGFREPPINSNMASVRISTTSKASLHPFSSSPVTMNILPPRLSLDESLDMQDMCDRFQKAVVVSAADTVGVAKWKRDQMVSTAKQLGRVCSSIVRKDRLGFDDGFTENPVLISLAKSLELLEPSEITAAAVASNTALRYHRQLAQKKLLSSLKTQTAELKEAREKTSRTTMDIRLQIQDTKDKLQKYEDEMAGTDAKEIKMLSEALQAEIVAEADQYARIGVMDTICNEVKIDQTIAEIKSLHQRAETLAEELEFAKLLPPNIREVRILVEERKERLRETINRVEDLVEFQFKRQS